MTVIDLLTRVDAICQKYDKYDVDKLNGANVAGDDPFARLYGSVDADINQCVEKAESAKQEKNRATVVALNAEIRRTKAKLLEEDLPKLQRLALKKDEGLDIIGEGLETLKNMASDMNEELDRQVPLMDEMDDKVDRANADLKNTNVRLKETVLQMRSSRNFCIDIILLCIILGIAAYLYKSSADLFHLYAVRSARLLPAAMSAVNITNVAVLDNPTAFLNPFQFEISYECLVPLDDDLEWKLIYVGSAEDENYDQQLESVLVGPVNVGTYRFVLQADPPDPSKIREEDIIGVTVLLLTCSYMGQEFMRVGYYVNNDYDDEQLREEPPAKVLIDRVQRNILADKPRVTKFPINFHPEPSTSTGQQQQEPQTASPENHTGEASKPDADQ
ncbi:hypothetical protein PR202_gb02048 [Eleusine coracana subsp. coracana]|uniref:t-SNARE coiled-coil homology domain-containing protein n=1 Tax=Eleusine coracana subsp. coracana TaxID=191504 RepID=A0AAV5DXM1_ELECO|nr:hypothetical protein PR202_gb02048 [Eleusine coracana subsp. coracana]